MKLLKPPIKGGFYFFLMYEIKSDSEPTPPTKHTHQQIETENESRMKKGIRKTKNPVILLNNECEAAKLLNLTAETM